ncbi:hypothetical protein AB838_16085 [Rhodobacteraceae bacterium (ex Bugula neritina AB1)]|nr:hypothetical protein AB838_16085 [Rhodobacteraceae bacterium (ex Bugula neritina AB1)]
MRRLLVRIGPIPMFSSSEAYAPGRASGAGLARMVPAAILALGAVLFAVNLWRNRFFLHDDAFISLRYARNFAEYGELSWNLGDRVEGYTNFLYVLISSGLLRLGLDPVLALRLINAAAVALLVAGVVYGLRALFPERRGVQAFGLALILGNVSAAVWLVGGLEAPLAAGFVTWGMVFLLQAMADDGSDTGNGRGTEHETGHGVSDSILAGSFFALAVLTRPDGVVVVAAAFVAFLVAARGSGRSRLLKALVIAGIPFAVAAIHMGWRMAYYGDLVPNTFHAKVGLDLAHRLGKVGAYLLKSALLYLPVLACGGLGLLAAAAQGRLTRVICVLATVCAAFLLYVVWSGGDHMAAARVLLPVSGPAALLAAAALAAMRPPYARGFAALCLGLLVAAAVNARSFRMDWAAFNGIIVGRYIEQAWPQDSLVALNTAGSTPFFAPSHRYIDMLGLNDRTIATRANVPKLARRQAMPGHGKGDGAYVLSRAPGYVILGGAEGIAVTEARNWFLTGVELSQLPEFSECYRKRTVSLEVPADMARFRPGAGPIPFTFYVRVCV